MLVQPGLCGTCSETALLVFRTVAGYLRHNGHLTEIAFYITRLDNRAFIFHQRIRVVALKNVNSALKLDFVNSHIYCHTLDDICHLYSYRFQVRPPEDIPET